MLDQYSRIWSACQPENEKRGFPKCGAGALPFLRGLWHNETRKDRQGRPLELRGVGRIPVLALLGAVLAGGAAPAQAQGERDTLRILFTHDTHDHWFPTESEGGVYGGYTRLATLLRRERQQKNECYLPING